MARRAGSVDVAVFLPSLAGGGAERAMLDVARSLHARGVEVELVLARAQGEFLSLVPDGLRCVDLGASRVLTSLPGLVRYLRRRRPEAIISTLSHANIVAAWARGLSRVPVRLVLRGANVAGSGGRGRTTLRGMLYRALLRRAYRRADVLVAASGAVADHMAETVGIPKERIEVVYNPVVTTELGAMAAAPVDHSWFESGAAPVVLGVGRLAPQKDFATLIRAFARVRERMDARLVVLGESDIQDREGAGRAELEQLVAELELGEYVSLPGFVSNPLAYMRRAAVFVLPSRWEGLPNVLIQALAVGVPVVATNCPGGTAEILEHGKWGRLVPPGDELALSEALMDVLRQPPPPTPPEAVDRFDACVVAEQYERLLLGEGRVKAR